MSQEISFTTQIKKEGDMFVAYSPELDVSSCGFSIDEARENLKDAVRGFLESAKDRGVLREILEESGYTIGAMDDHQWSAPEFLLFEKTMVPLQYA